MSLNLGGVVISKTKGSLKLIFGQSYFYQMAIKW